jgi:hypothetical protein
LTTVPTAGETDHVTDASVEPVTKPVNCWVWDAESAVDVGETLTPIVGSSVIVALALWVRPFAPIAPSARTFAGPLPIAVTITVSGCVINAGAVYTPWLDILPRLLSRIPVCPDSDHVTA